MLKRELIFILACKALFLWGIWALFFAHPLQDHLNDRVLGERMVSMPTTAVKTAA